MNEEQLLRERLDEITVPPSRIDMGSVLPAARRRVARRRIAVLSGAAALTAAALIAVPALLPEKKSANGILPAVTACVSNGLTAPAGVKDPIVRGVDPSGRYIIGSGTVGQLLRPVLWTDGKVQTLPALADVVEATDVNQSGVVVGLVGGLDNGGKGVVRYENGRWTSLTLPSGEWNVYPEPRINAGGDVIVNAEPVSNAGQAVHLLWPAGAVEAEQLTLPNGAVMHDIADDGGITGVVHAGDETSAWVWDRTGKGVELEEPDGQSVTAYAIQGDWVAGGTSDDEAAVLWNRTSGRITRLNAEGAGAAVNSSGWAVADNATVRDGAPLDLGGGTAVGVSDTGLVVGYTSEETPTFWRC